MTYIHEKPAIVLLMGRRCRGREVDMPIRPLSCDPWSRDPAQPSSM
jgi:hypothetical protein